MKQLSEGKDGHYCSCALAGARIEMLPNPDGLTYRCGRCGASEQAVKRAMDLVQRRWTENA